MDVRMEAMNNYFYLLSVGASLLSNENEPSFGKTWQLAGVSWEILVMGI